MIKYDRDRVRQAVQLLVDGSYFHHHVKRLHTTVERPRALPFSGDTEPLNELLIVGRQNRQALENLIELAASKRSNKNDYQREYMAAKRARDTKVLQLESLLTGATLPASEKRSVLQRQHSIWRKEKDRFLAGVSDWYERNERTKEFWSLKEKELDALIEEAQNSGPIRRQPKRVVVVKKQPSTGFGEKLSMALDNG